MTPEQKTEEYISWFKDNSTPSMFVHEVMFMACAAGSMKIDNDNIDIYMFLGQDSKSNIELTIKRVT